MTAEWRAMGPARRPASLVAPTIVFQPAELPAERQIPPRQSFRKKVTAATS